MDWLLSIVLAGVSAFAWYFYLLPEKKRIQKISNAIERYGGDPAYPFIGTGLRLLKTSTEDLYQVLLDYGEENAPIFRSWVLQDASVHFARAPQAEILLKSSTLITKSSDYNFFYPWLGEGLLTSKDAKWFNHRKLLTPTFHFNILDNFSEVFSEKAEKLANELILPQADGQFFDIIPFINLCAIDIICETAMGVKINAMDNSKSEYVLAVDGITEVITRRLYNPFYYPDTLFRLFGLESIQNKHLSVLHGFARKVIKQKKAQYQVNKNSTNEDNMGRKQRKAFLDLLIEQGDNFTDEELREQVDTFAFAGQDTTSITASWALFNIANYPEVQQNIVEELDDIFHGEERLITPEDLSNMKYLERVIKESLRLYPTVPCISRKLTEDLNLDGNILPAGLTAIIEIRNVHIDPEQYPEPTKFDPDRFLPEIASKRHPFAFIPFSAGPRNCIGQKFAMRNVKTMLATLLRKFEIKALKTPEETKKLLGVVTRPVDGIKLLFKLRKEVKSR